MGCKRHGSNAVISLEDEAEIMFPYLILGELIMFLLKQTKHAKIEKASHIFVLLQ